METLKRKEDQEAHSALSLRANFSWALTGNLVYAGCLWGLLVILAKIGSVESVGQFALGLAVTGPIFMLSNCKLRAVQATDSEKEFGIEQYIGHRLLSTTISLGLVFVIAWSQYQFATALVIVAIGLAKAFESISDVLYGWLQGKERMDLISKSLMIKGPLSLLLLGSIMYFTESLFLASLGLAAAWFSVLLWFDLRQARLEVQRTGDPQLSLLPEFKPRILKRMTRRVLPLGISMMLISLITNIPRYFIEHYHGVEALGIFAAMAYLIIAGMTIVGALGQSASPRLARYFLSGDHASFTFLLRRLGALGVLLGVAGTIVAIFFGEELLTLLYQPEYAQHNQTFVVLMIAGGFAYLANFLGYGLTATREFHRQLVPFVVVTASTTLLSLILVPQFGIIGAAWALLLSNALNCFLFWLVLRSLTNQPIVPQTSTIAESYAS